MYNQTAFAFIMKVISHSNSLGVFLCDLRSHYITLPRLGAGLPLISTPSKPARGVLSGGSLVPRPSICCTCISVMALTDSALNRLAKHPEMQKHYVCHYHDGLLINHLVTSSKSWFINVISGRSSTISEPIY